LKGVNTDVVTVT